MSLTSGRGPLASRPAGMFVPALLVPVVYLEPFRRRVRGLRAGETLIDSDSVVLVHRPDRPPEYAFPGTDVRLERVDPLDCLDGYVTVAWDALDTWMEEEEEVVMHPRNPYHRVDCLRSRRRLVVSVSGRVIVDTDVTVAVHETALEPRLYVDRGQVAGAHLVPSATSSYCRYKGEASYWDLAVGDTKVTDAAWSYERPLAESAAIAGLVSFDEQRVTVTTTLPPAAALRLAAG